MSNLSIKINLAKLAGAGLANLKGKSGTTKECIVIPVEDANLFIGEKGVYLDLTALEYREQKYDNTHFVKQSVPKDLYTGMSEEERNSQPIIGSVKPFVPAKMQATNEYEPQHDDLPF
jgi:hypothetical protein